MRCHDDVYPITGATARPGCRVPRSRPGIDPRVRRLAVASLALLCVFVMAAGTIVAHLLPLRLDQCDVARVAARPGGRRPVAPAGSRAGHGRIGQRRGRQHGRDPSRAGRGTGPAADLGRSRTARRDAGHQPGYRAGAVLQQRHRGLRPGLDHQGGHGGSGPVGPGAGRPPAHHGGGRPDLAGSIVLVGGGDPTLAAGAPPASRVPAAGHAGRRWPGRPPGRCAPAAGTA